MRNNIFKVVFALLLSFSSVFADGQRQTAITEADIFVEDDEVVDGINKMNLQELIAMAEEAGYDKAEWKKFTTKTEKSAVKLMSAYLIKKYNADKAE